MKVGSKVQIINWKLNNGKRPDHWNSVGKMDEWCDKIVTIRKKVPGFGKFRIEEDRGRWIWCSVDFKTPFLDDEMFEI